MKLITCLYKGEERVGALTEEGAAFLPYPDMNTLIESLPPAAFAVTSTAKPVPLEDVTLLAPIPRPRQDVILLSIRHTIREILGSVCTSSHQSPPICRLISCVM